MGRVGVELVESVHDDLPKLERRCLTPVLRLSTKGRVLRTVWSGGVRVFASSSFVMLFGSPLVLRRKSSVLNIGFEPFALRPLMLSVLRRSSATFPGVFRRMVFVAVDGH